MPEEMGVMQTESQPVGETVAPERSAPSETQTSEPAQSSAYDSLISDGESDQVVSPTTEEGNVDTSTNDKIEGTPSADVNDQKLPETIPYARFAEVNNKAKEAEDRARQYEEFMNNPEAVQKWLTDNAKTQEISSNQDVAPLDTFESINEKILDLDLLSDDFIKQLYDLNVKKDALYLEKITSTMYQERQTSELVTQQELVLDSVFKDRPIEERQNAEKFAMDWSDKNPGAKFPFPGEKGWRSITQFVNGTTDNAKEAGRQEVLQTMGVKRVLDSSVSTVPPAIVSSTPDPYKSLYED